MLSPAAQLQDFLDGLLPDPERAEFQAHLAGCAHCAAELALYRRVFRELESMEREAFGFSLSETAAS